jgi:hypothetical protein
MSLPFATGMANLVECGWRQPSNSRLNFRTRHTAEPGAQTCLRSDMLRLPLSVGGHAQDIAQVAVLAGVEHHGGGILPRSAHHSTGSSGMTGARSILAGRTPDI